MLEFVERHISTINYSNNVIPYCVEKNVSVRFTKTQTIYSSGVEKWEKVKRFVVSTPNVMLALMLAYKIKSFGSKI